MFRKTICLMSALLLAGISFLRAHVENEITYLFEDKGLTIHCAPSAVYNLLTLELNIKKERISLLDEYEGQLASYFNKTIELVHGNNRVAFINPQSNLDGHDGTIFFEYDNPLELITPVELSITSFHASFHRPKNYVIWRISGMEDRYVLSREQHQVSIVYKGDSKSNSRFPIYLWVIIGVIVSVLFIWRLQTKKVE